MIDAWIDGAWVLAIVVAALAAWRILATHRGHPVGWSFALLAAALGAIAVADVYARRGLLARPGSLPGAAVAAQLSTTLFVFGFIALGLILALTPTGQPVSPRWHRATQLMVATGIVWFALRQIRPGPIAEPFQAVDNPWGIGPTVPRLARLVPAVLFHLLIVASAVSLVVRFRRATGNERRQLLWMVVVAVPLPLLLAAMFAGALIDRQPVLGVAVAGFILLPPLGAVLAIQRYRLYDVDRILSRAAAFLVVTVAMAATYLFVVVVVAQSIGQRVGGSVSTAVATLAVAVAVRPVHAAAQDAIDRRFARRRHDALRQVRAFVDRPDPGRPVVDLLRSALGDPALAVAYRVPDDTGDTGDDTGGWVTEDGREIVPAPDAVAVERAGRVVASVASTADPSTVRAVVDTASPLLETVALRAAVARQLQAVVVSRRRIAEAQLGERRRIERDLHDGAQQRLLGAAAQLQAALVNGDPARMRDAMELGVAECRQAVVELRDLANGLYPAVLTDHGLAAALEDLADRFPAEIAVEAPTGRYQPDLEATLWFVACEAVTNAVKHSCGTRIQVALHDDGERLRLMVSDDGRGGADLDGNGLRGLSDRLEAVGGTLRVAADGPGTMVEATVPCTS